MINNTNGFFSAGKLARWYQLIGTALLLLCSFSGWASTSCYLLNNTTYTPPSYTKTVNVLGTSGDTQLGDEIVLEENPNALASSCKGVGANNDLDFSTYAGDKVIATVDGIPVLRTDTKGIGYAMGLRCIARSTDGCDSNKNQTLWIGQPDNWNSSRAWYPYDSTATMYWRVVLRIYQLRDYQFLGDQAAANIKDQFTNGGQLQIGGVGQPTANIHIGSVFLFLNGNYPTCMITSSQGGNVINLGDYSISDLRNNTSLRRVPFIINFSQCSSLSTIVTKLTSNFVIPSTPLMGNKNGNLGVGVEISTGNNTILQPNDANSRYLETGAFGASYYPMTLYATLKNSGQGTVIPGSFETGATLTFTYQ